MARLIGYGAYNLCFDRDLGAQSGQPNFFQSIHNGGWPVNLMKIICYRNATQEGLPLGDPRTIQLYRPSGEINGYFLDNLVKLVQTARPLGFTVQICVFSYHSVARDEAPNPLPAVLARGASETKCNYFKRFFSLSDPGVVAEQEKLVRTLVNQLRVSGNLYDHVIWELANEVRCDICGTGNAGANCTLVPWLNHMATIIRDTARGIPTTILTSTGVYFDSNPNQPGAKNEKMTFDKNRPADGCANPALVPDLFDLHSGQWDAGKITAGDMIRNGVKMRFQPYGYPNPMFIINTDGIDDSLLTKANISFWAKAAFQTGYHFACKAQYPPEPYNTAVLDALKAANAAVP
ncbi:MAG TPA: hypothetical protein VMU84_20120 [Thermoanaerobaculia bacterium]|nr:hypothetical protein [Thermoanaerobaculia bacterium]